jgi:hypothetical protein
LARLDESIAAFNQRFILNLWNQGTLLVKEGRMDDAKTLRSSTAVYDKELHKRLIMVCINDMPNYLLFTL